ncbi:MAG TPA: aminotransferase class V-fold PLP-dependent enzyme [Mycobacteriales bacterium]|nr:aminotransferase class V-fold PLP-dependent enzyme [Mycobacteriales bacterium]
MANGAYLDAASGAPLHPAAATALAAALADGWADPATLYGAGRRSRLLLDGAREAVAAVLGARPDEVTFCASGTQAAHLAVLGGLAGRRRAGTRFVHSAVEHSCVLHAAGRHVAAGGSAASVPVHRDGRVDPAAFTNAAAGAALASLMTGNHEVGTLQPVAEVAAGCRELGVPLHTDAAQSAGRLPVPPGWSLLSASAHKWGGPPGVGVLVVRTGTRWRSPLPADEREGGRVPGFENVPAIVAAAAALEAVAGSAPAENARLSALVDRIRDRVAATVPDVEVAGHPVDRLPHLVTFSCLYVDGEALLHELDRHGFAVSSGSSCTSSTLTPSHVLEAMGVLSHGNVRVSLHRDTTEDEVERFLAVLPWIVAKLRVGLEGL